MLAAALCSCRLPRRLSRKPETIEKPPTAGSGGAGLRTDEHRFVFSIPINPKVSSLQYSIDSGLVTLAVDRLANRCRVDGCCRHHQRRAPQEPDRGRAGQDRNWCI
jgi:hypothetical protein